MTKVIFLDEMYRASVPHDRSPIDELNRLNRGISGGKDLRDRINARLQSPPYRVNTDTTIEGIVNEQRMRAYLLKEKGIMVLYPESGSKRFNSGLELVFPHNLDPEMSLATLVALEERYGKGYQSSLFEDGQKSQFDFNGKKEALILAALRYLVASQPFAGDRRGFREREIYDAAKIFMEKYEVLKKGMMAKGSDASESFVLMAAFAATYNRIKEVFRSAEFRNKFPFSYEFFDIAPRDVNVYQVIGSIDEKPVKKYIRTQELENLPTKRKWDMVRTELHKEPIAR